MWTEILDNNPPLSAAAEAGLWVRIKAGDEGARNTLLLSCVRLCRSLAARRADAARVERDDLISAAFFGLFSALHYYNPDKNGIRFHRIAFFEIKKAVRAEVRRQLSPCHVPPLKPLPGCVGDYDFSKTPTDAPGPAESAEANDAARALRAAVAALPGRQRQLIEIRFGLGGKKPLTLDAAAQVLGFSGERARQVEGNALCKLRKILSGGGLPRNTSGPRCPAGPANHRDGPPRHNFTGGGRGPRKAGNAPPSPHKDNGQNIAGREARARFFTKGFST